MYIVSFVIGLIIVVSSIFLIQYEFNIAVRNQALLLEQSKLYKNSDLFDMLESLQTSIDEMNRAFYDIASDLEGKYSIHEKEIELINQMLETLKKQVVSGNLGSEISKSSSRDSTKVISNEIKTNINQMNKKLEAASGLSAELKRSGNQVKEDVYNQNYEKDVNPNIKEQELIDQVIEMRSRGKTLAQIAKELGIGMGEIQLLLSLKK